MLPKRWYLAALSVLLAYCADAGARERRVLPNQAGKAPVHAPRKAKSPGKAKKRKKAAVEAIEAAEPVDEDFERRAAELRAWLQQRQEERNRLGYNTKESELGNELEETEYSSATPDASRSVRRYTTTGPQKTGNRRRHASKPSKKPPKVLRSKTRGSGKPAVR